MPVILEAVQKASTNEERARSARLNFVTKLIDGSYVSQDSQPSWYDSYLHECIVSAFVPTVIGDSQSNSRNNEVGCLALVAGMHFIQTKDAQNIFEQLLKQIVMEERKIHQAEKQLF